MLHSRTKFVLGLMSCLPISPRCLTVLERFLNSLTQQQDYATATAGEGTAGEVARRRQDLSWVAPVLFILLQVGALGLT